jgi:flagellar protein FlbT
MALRLTLKPGERLIIGNAVVRMGRLRGELYVDSKTPVLRESDILSPGAVKTPCERIVLALQLAYVDPDRLARHLTAYRQLAAEVRGAAPSTAALLDKIDREIAVGRHYQALKAGRMLITYERELMSHVR